MRLVSAPQSGTAGQDPPDVQAVRMSPVSSGQSVRDRPPRQVCRGPCSPTLGLDRLTVQGYLLVRLWKPAGGLVWAARVPTSSRELPSGPRLASGRGLPGGLGRDPRPMLPGGRGPRRGCPRTPPGPLNPSPWPLLLGRLFQDLP